MQKGFTLIEILVVFAVMSALLFSSMAAFDSYNRSQTFQTSVANIVSVLNVAKSRSLTQVKPSQCGTKVLQGYQVSISTATSTYLLQVVCDTTVYTLSTGTLPSQVTFAAGATTPILFAVSTGVVRSVSTVTINGYGKAKTIT